MPVRITITVDTESGAAEVRTTGAEQAAGAGTGAADPPTLTPRRDDDGSTAAAAAGASDAGSPAAPEDIGDPGAASTEVDTAITPPREVPAGGDDDARDDDDADVDRPRAVDDLDDGDGGGKTPAKRAKKTTRAKKTARKRS